MDFYTAAEVAENYSNFGVKKTSLSNLKLFVLAILSGFIVGIGGIVTNTAAHTVTDAALIRVICGLLFPFALGMVIIMGSELFTGNNMIIISVLERKARVSGMLRNWFFVYMGNFFGALAVAYIAAMFRMFNYTDNLLAAFTINIAVYKTSLPYSVILVKGIMCNILVCLGVLCSLSAHDTAGRILGAYIPISFFVISGFEHSIANMYYIPAGLFAMMVPEYLEKAHELGINTDSLTWSNFIFRNLVPSTVGNIIGGMSIGIWMWACYLRKSNLYTKNRRVNKVDRRQRTEDRRTQSADS
jgi:formate/nitrite transporter